MAETHKIYLNQSLLYEAADSLSHIWNTPAELDSDVASFRDLWIDYAPTREVSLGEALDYIVRFVEDSHHVRLHWVAVDGHIRISSDKMKQGVAPND